MSMFFDQIIWATY